MRAMGFWTWAAVLVGSVASAAEVDFDRDIAPLFARRCLSCHAGEDSKGQLDLTLKERTLKGGESGPALKPGSPDDSPLWQRVAADEMPPKHPLPAAEKRLLAEWIAAGAPWSAGAIDPLKYSSDERAGYDWWSLQALQRPSIPADATGWSRTPVDRFISQRLQTANVAPTGEADRRVLIRRLSFDLLGLPPSPEDIDAFVHDPRPDAYEQLVERSLASPHFGERWARAWLDIVRFGESNGFERDLPRANAWHYRNWVIQAFNADLPYDEFVRWQLAGDMIAPDDPAAAAALGFLVAGPHDTVVPVSDRMRQTMRQDELEDVVGVVGQTFLGLTVNCARCHDHKFDPISTREYYQFVAALAGVDHGERDVVPPPVKRQLQIWNEQIATLEDQLRRQAEPIQQALLSERATSSPITTSPVLLPAPLAAWDFTRGLEDQRGRLPVQLQGAAKLTPAGLELDGASFAMTPPLPDDLTEKTLEVRVKLADLEQQAGGALSVQALDGSVFDAIVFAEQQPRRWLAGSNGFVRTSSWEGPEEAVAANEFVTVTVVYRPDGTIAGYRNGKPYGRSYQSTGPVKLAAGKSQVAFGLRHSPPGGNRFLKGTLAAARVYPRALTDKEVATSAATTGVLLTEADVLAQLSPDERSERERRTAELVQLQRQHAELSKTGPIKMYTAALTQPKAAGRVLKRGNVADPGEEVPLAGLSALKTLPASFELHPEALEYQRRVKLAEWITDRRNPLFARVMANRLWHYHFGAGLIETPNDLGFNAGRPSHPELLDWLACELVDSGYSLKHLHRLLVTSATYRQASTFRAEIAERDAQNRLLWRMTPRRLDAESVRDAMLVAAGELNPALGGQGYNDFNSYFFKGTQFYEPLDPVGYANQRRTIYRMWARGGRSPFLDTFDCPDPSSTTPKRSSTTTPLQALSLMNHAFVLRMADQLAERLQEDSGSDAARQTDRAYELLFGRKATPEEAQFVLRFIEQRGLPSACRGLFNAAEFLYVD
jgi:hypothetical protein